MITAILSLGNIRGADVWLLGWFLCGTVYFLVSLLQRCNRTKTGAENLLFWFLTAEVFTDFIWALYFYPDSVYRNPGIGGAILGLMVWPTALLAGGILSVRQNRRL